MSWRYFISTRMRDWNSIEIIYVFSKSSICLMKTIETMNLSPHIEEPKIYFKIIMNSTKLLYTHVNWFKPQFKDKSVDLRKMLQSNKDYSNQVENDDDRERHSSSANVWEDKLKIANQFLHLQKKKLIVFSSQINPKDIFQVFFFFISHHISRRVSKREKHLSSSLLLSSNWSLSKRFFLFFSFQLFFS